MQTSGVFDLCKGADFAPKFCGFLCRGIELQIRFQVLPAEPSSSSKFLSRRWEFPLRRSAARPPSDGLPFTAARIPSTGKDLPPRNPTLSSRGWTHPRVCRGGDRISPLQPEDSPYWWIYTPYRYYSIGLENLPTSETPFSPL
jgi:hypothetical protein